MASPDWAGSARWGRRWWGRRSSRHRRDHAPGGTAAGTTAFYRCALALRAWPCSPSSSNAGAARGSSRNGPGRRSQAGSSASTWSCGRTPSTTWSRVSTVLGNLQVVFVVFVTWAFFRERPRSGFLAACLWWCWAWSWWPASWARQARATTPWPACYMAWAPPSPMPLSSSSYGGAPRPRHMWPARSPTPRPGRLRRPGARGRLGELSFAPPLSAFGWLLLTAFASQTVGWLLITWSLPRLPAALSSLLLLFQPAVSLVMAAVVLSQTADHPAVGGCPARLRRRPGRGPVRPSPAVTPTEEPGLI